jgi:hypothetical protein
MYKDFQSKFLVISEELTSRFQTAGVLNGDFCIIRPDALKCPKLRERGSQYMDKIKEYITSKLPLKVCAVKTERPETSNSIAGQGDLITATWVDVVQELAPGLWTQPMSLPLECIDVVMPDGNNWSPDHPQSWKRKDDTIIHPQEVKLSDDNDLQKQTSGKDRKLPTKNEKGGPAKEPKDGRKQAKKPEEYKRSVKKEAVEAIQDASELLGEIYQQMPLRGK